MYMIQTTFSLLIYNKYISKFVLYAIHIYVTNKSYTYFVLTICAYIHARIAYNIHQRYFKQFFNIL